MDIYIYGDESGVFDQKHNDTYVFGGLIFLTETSKDEAYRRFNHAEKQICDIYYQKYKCKCELKASILESKHKTGLFRSLNTQIKYAFVINQRKVLKEIFLDKKSRQRYLDFVYKVGLKRVFQKLITEGKIDKDSINDIYVRFDEHNTATNGRYELREAIEEEFKRGTFNYNYNIFYQPIFPKMSGNVIVNFKSSETDALIRASDIIANYAFHHVITGNVGKLRSKLYVERFP